MITQGIIQEVVVIGAGVFLGIAAYQLFGWLLRSIKRLFTR